MAAEQSVLGGMLLSKDAIADVVEKLLSADFYRPAHQAVYDAILELYGKGEPADAVTVSAELERAGELRRVGGAPYLHTLISTVPTAANAGYYAEIVAEKADRLIAAMRAAGCTLNNAYMQHSLLALVVIPSLRISDKGIVDVERFELVDLFV